MSTEARIDYPAFNQLAPAATAALSALSNSVVDSGLADLDKQLVDLSKSAPPSSTVAPSVFSTISTSRAK